MTLTDLLNVTCCSVRVVKHCGVKENFFINFFVMQCPTETIYKKVKGLEQYANYEILSISAYDNGVEPVLTVTI